MITLSEDEARYVILALEAYVHELDNERCAREDVDIKIELGQEVIYGNELCMRLKSEV